MFPSKHKRLFLILPAVILMTYSCTPPSSAQMQVTIPAYTWNKDSPLEMQIPIPDSTGVYHAFLDIRTTKNYPYPYLAVIVSYGTPAVQEAGLSWQHTDTLWLPFLPEQAIRSGMFLDYRFLVDTTGIQAKGPVLSWKLQHHMPAHSVQGLVKTGILLKQQLHGKKQTAPF